MRIQLNGEPIAVAEETTIGDLIREKCLDPRTIVVEHNRTIVPTGDLDRIRLEENDALEVLRFVGGG